MIIYNFHQYTIPIISNQNHDNLQHNIISYENNMKLLLVKDSIAATHQQQGWIPFSTTTTSSELLQNQPHRPEQSEEWNNCPNILKTFVCLFFLSLRIIKVVIRFWYICHRLCGGRSVDPEEDVYTKLDLTKPESFIKDWWAIQNKRQEDTEAKLRLNWER